MMSRSQVIASVTSHRQQLMQYVILIVSYLAKKSIVGVVDKFSRRQYQDMVIRDVKPDYYLTGELGLPTSA